MCPFSVWSARLALADGVGGLERFRMSCVFRSPLMLTGKRSLIIHVFSPESVGSRGELEFHMGLPYWKKMWLG